MKLRDYQKECLDAIESAGNGRWLCQLATGMGKTVIFSHIPRKGNVLLLSHRQELVRQPVKYFDCPVGIDLGKEFSGGESVISASIQTMGRRLEKFAPEHFHTIIVDEAHHAAAESYQKILRYFHPERVLGFTATPNRGDGLGLDSVFDRIIFHRDLRWGIENGYLSSIHAKRVDIGYDLRGVSCRMGDYSPADLERAVNVEKCNKAIAEIVQNIAEPPCLIFAVDVAHAESIAAEIPGAVALSAKSKDRSAVVEAFKKGKIKVLVNCALFTEGTDLPNTRTVIIARPTKSAGLYAQMVGRGTRLAPGKKHCLLIDCVGTSRLPLCTAPTLLGLDPSAVPERYAAEVEGDLLNDIPEIINRSCDTPESWIENIRLVDLWAKSNKYMLHDVNWQRLPTGMLTLSLPGKIWLRLSAPDLAGKVLFETSGGYKQVFAAQDAYDTAYMCLRQKFSDLRPLWSLSSVKRWGKAPATEAQKKMVRFLARNEVDVSGIIKSLTKSQAASVIERLKNQSRRGANPGIT